MGDTQPVRVGLLGAGAWGLNHMRVLLAETRCKLVAVVDPDEAARARAAELGPDLCVQSDASHVLEDPGVDAVVIATPGPTHAALAQAALNAGKHVLVEKPFAMSLADAKAVARAAAKHGRTAMAGHLMVSHPAVLRMKQLLDSGALGDVRYAHAIRAGMGRIRRDENVMWSFAPHELSILDFVLERSPICVSAHGQSILHPGVPDVAFITLGYEDGRTVQVNLSRVHPRKERRFTLVCSRKMVEFDDTASDKLRIEDKAYDVPPAFSDYSEYLTLGDGDVFIPKLPIEEPLRLQLRHFLAALSTSIAPRADIHSAMRVTAVLEAAERSLALDGAPVQVAPV